MSALTPRTWAEGDRVAQVDRRTPNWCWMRGTVTGVGVTLGTNAATMIVRWDDATTVSVVRCDDERVIPADEVPIDERHWLSQDERDRLVRQEAAERLRGMARALDHDDALLGLAALLDDLVGAGGGGWLPTGGSWSTTADLIRAARLLLAPARRRASIPTVTSGVHS